MKTPVHGMLVSLPLLDLEPSRPEAGSCQSPVQGLVVEPAFDTHPLS